LQYIAEGFPNSNLDFPSMALQYLKDGKPSGNEYYYRTVGFVGNANYNYDNRYFIDGTFRMDGSSQFGANKRFAPFWSAGLGWNLHEEKFFKKNEVVNRLKLRGSVGTSGSTKFNTYQALTTYSYYTSDRYYNWLGAYILGLGNPDLKWQQVLKYNIGTDIDLFNRYLTLQANYYIENTNDLVSSVNTPASNGVDYYTANIGKLRNKGFELYATVYLIKTTGLTWSISGSVLHNKNKVLETSQALKDAQKTLQGTSIMQTRCISKATQVMQYG
jgi:outer membrane receptor protein involved in Fe transport